MITKLLKMVKRGRCRRGFSLVEVMAGMAILAFALASAYGIAITNARIIESNQNLAAAANLAEYKIEELRNCSFDNIVDGSDGPMNAMGHASTTGLFTRAWTVQDGAPSLASNELKTIVVAVSWSQMGRNQVYTLTGVVKR